MKIRVFYTFFVFYYHFHFEVQLKPMTATSNCFLSLGGFTALVAAASLQDQVRGIVLLNSAGQFGDTIPPTTETEENFVQKFVLKPLKEAFQRVALGFLFWQAKQPSRVESVLKSVRSLP